MLHRRVVSDLGRPVYGLGAIALGIIGLAWGDFASVWQPIQSFGEIPHRTALAYAFAAALLCAGIASQFFRTARSGLAALVLLHAFSTLFWLPRVIGFPRIYGTWAGFFEQFSLVAAGLVAFAALAPTPFSTSTRLIATGRILYGLCPVSFGIAHFTALSGTTAMVPRWIPPSQLFWAEATGALHILAGLAIVSGLLAGLASRLLTAMILLFGALVWLPTLLATPRDHTAWAGNAINLTMAGAAWIVADSIANRRKRPESEPLSATHS